MNAIASWSTNQPQITCISLNNYRVKINDGLTYNLTFILCKLIVLEVGIMKNKKENEMYGDIQKGAPLLVTDLSIRK